MKTAQSGSGINSAMNREVAVEPPKGASWISPARKGGVADDMAVQPPKGAAYSHECERGMHMSPPSGARGNFARSIPALTRAAKSFRPLRGLYCLAFLTSIIAMAACQPKADSPAPEPSSTSAPAVTNRIDIPPQVVSNLGITFAKVEKRRVARTLRVPGVLESPQGARHVYTARYSGRVMLDAQQYSRVRANAKLFRIDSPEIARASAAIAEADQRLLRAQAELDAAKAEVEAHAAVLAVWPDRIAAAEGMVTASSDQAIRLQEAVMHWVGQVTRIEELDRTTGGQAASLAEARGKLIESRTALAEEAKNRASYTSQVAEHRGNFASDKARGVALAARHTGATLEVASAEQAAEFLRIQAGKSFGIAEDELTAEKAYRVGPAFETVLSDGVVSRVLVSHGQYVEAGTEVLEVLDDSWVTFRARALQADLPLLRDDLEVSIVPPAGGPIAGQSPLKGTLSLAPEADPDARTFDILVHKLPRAPWARPGVTAEAEIVYDATAEERFAVPVACVIQDGLNKIIFMRDRNNRDKVVRLTPRFGLSDGRWIVVETDVFTDDEVVLHGAYELKLTGAGKPSGKGHFHADGTYHEGDDH